MAGAEAELDQGAGVGDGFVLPTVVGLEPAKSIFCGRIPLPRRLAGQVVLTDESFLDLLRAFRINLLLPLDLFCALPLM